MRIEEEHECPNCGKTIQLICLRRPHIRCYRTETENTTGLNYVRVSGKYEYRVKESEDIIVPPKMVNGKLVKGHFKT